jgi:serine/threonine protein phosphatase PrpC
MTNEAIAVTLAAETEPEGAAKKLVAQALAAGSADNVTVLIVRFDFSDSVGAGPHDAR